MIEFIQDNFDSKIRDIVSEQRGGGREAIFFMYEDGTASEKIVGEATKIEINKDEKKRIFNRGDVIGSVHTHPAGFDPSTIDIMTAISTNQDNMCVAVPITYEDGRQDYSLSCVNLEDLGRLDERSLFRGMRRSMFSLTRTGQDFRKKLNLQASRAKGYRSHEVVREGIQFPTTERPSLLDIEAGTELGVRSGDTIFLD